jgi:hypothetical protein
MNDNMSRIRCTHDKFALGEKRKDRYILLST